MVRHATASKTTRQKADLVIPAYQPSETLPDLIAAIHGHPESPIEHVVVVDDGSGSEFSPVFCAVQNMPCVTLLRHAVNLGKGAALKTGFNHALLQFPDSAGIITADADGQHAPEDVVQVARALVETPDRMILGTRGFSGDVPLRSRLGNAITRRIFRVFTGSDVPDTQTGLRGWPVAACRDSLRIAINGYDFELECLLRAHRWNQDGIRHVPISTIYTDDNRSSHFRPIRDSARIYRVFFRYCASSAWPR